MSRIVYNRYAEPAEQEEFDERVFMPHRRNGTAHEQAEIFVGGEFTTVDIKLEWMIRTLNAHGFATLSSCQGFKSKKKARKNGFTEPRAYIEFAGESAWELLLRIGGDDIAAYDSAIHDESWHKMLNCRMERDGKLILPAFKGSQWTVQYVSRYAGRGRGRDSSGQYNTVVLFPREELDAFRQNIEDVLRGDV